MDVRGYVGTSCYHQQVLLTHVQRLRVSWSCLHHSDGVPTPLRDVCQNLQETQIDTLDHSPLCLFECRAPL